MDRKEIYEDVDWTHLSQNKVQLWAFVKMVMKLSGFIKGCEFL